MKYKTGLVWLWLSLVVIVGDLWSKYVVVTNFHFYESVNVFPIFNLTYARNYGAAFSFLADHDGWQTYFFLGLAVVISAALTVMLYRNKETQAVKKWENIAYSLIIGGALGNAIDRAVDKCSLLGFTPDEPYNRLNVCQGYVVDFFDFYWNWDGYHFATFNVADIASSVGAGLLVLAAFFESKKKKSD